MPLLRAVAPCCTRSSYWLRIKDFNSSREKLSLACGKTGVSGSFKNGLWLKRFGIIFAMLRHMTSIRIITPLRYLIANFYSFFVEDKNRQAVEFISIGGKTMWSFSILYKRQFIQFGLFNLLSNFKDVEKTRISCSGLLVFKILLEEQHSGFKVRHKACKISCLNAEGFRRR